MFHVHLKKGVFSDIMQKECIFYKSKRATFFIMFILLSPYLFFVYLICLF